MGPPSRGADNCRAGNCRVHSYTNHHKARGRGVVVPALHPCEVVRQYRGLPSTASDRATYPGLAQSTSADGAEPFQGGIANVLTFSLFLTAAHDTMFMKTSAVAVLAAAPIAP